MPRRRPFGVRRSFTRPARRSVLVVIGAEKTETACLKGLARRFHLGAVTMDVVEKPGAPDQLVTYARDVYGSEGYGQIWCVTDVDHYEREGGKVTTAVAIAAKTGIEMAVSNPCFALNPSTSVWRLVGALLEKE